MAERHTPLPYRVLVVEDSIDDSELILRELRKSGRAVEFEQVESREALLGALGRGSWDAVISDYRLPQILGDEVLALVRQQDADVPIIFVSGTIGEELAVELLKAGADDYVMKGNLARLPSAISRAQQQREERRARERSDLALRESESRFRQLAQNIRAFFYLTNTENSEILYASLAYEAIWGRSLASLYADPRSWFTAVHPADKEHVAGILDARVAEAREVEYRIIRPDGSVRWIRSRGFPVLDERGQPYRIAAIVEDETERKLAADRIRRLNRVYAVLSGINGLIVRAQHRAELFSEASRIAVEVGRFRMAWLGSYDPSEMVVVPVASHGHEEGFLGLMSMSLKDPAPEGRGLVRRAVREKRPVVINDVSTDDKFRLRHEALARGYGSAAALPLTIRGEVIGVLGFFAPEPKFFDDEEMRLLTELAGDISLALDHIQKSERLEYLAYYDPLTGLAQRSLFVERVGQLIHAAELSRSKLAVIVSDLERFKAVNDSMGRQAGDLLLTQFAVRLRECVSDQTHLARLEADHFAIVLPEATNEFEAARMLGHLARACLDKPMAIGEEELRLSAKAGIAIFPDHGVDADTLLSNAEAAVRACKKAGERHLFFEPGMTERVAEKLSLENQLRRALERQEFVLHYQPRIDLESRSILGAEALIRWKTTGGLVPPAKFIPLLEETGLILEVGAWALQRAILDHKSWVDQGMDAPRIAVNVSAVQLRRRDFVSTVKRAIQLGVSPPGVDLEITESMVMHDVESNIEKLRSVRALGLDVAIDDFGTGYSSLAYLAKLPVCSLKIDRSFIITMLEDANTMTLVSTIISLAHSLKLKVVAEGVDAEDQARTLRLLRCDEMQGYLFSKPLPGEELEKLLGKGDT